MANETNDRPHVQIMQFNPEIGQWVELPIYAEMRAVRREIEALKVEIKLLKAELKQTANFADPRFSADR